MTGLAEASPARVLVVEDETELRDVTVDFLKIEGIDADGVGSLGAAEHWLTTHECDVLVLDLGLPDGDGREWLAARPDLLARGVIVTTARGDSRDRIAGARAGADAYLVKPVALEELTTLIGNLMRRVRPTSAGGWSLDAVAWTLRAPSGGTVELTRSEFALLDALARHAGAAVRRNDLIQALGHDPSYYDARRMEVLVRRLRTKVQETLAVALPLKTVHGQGYALTAAIERLGDASAGR